MEVAIHNESEIKSWLKRVLNKENIKDLSVKILGNSEKGDGYLGDIVFVKTTGLTNDGSTKEYNLVLKCSKRSPILRKNSPVVEAFKTEIYVYDTVFPIFAQFQTKKSIEEPFNSIPRCYGTYTGNDMEVVVFENLRKSGYSLWGKKNALTRKHISMVVKEYGKFHAISVAMRDQQPENFQQLTRGFTVDTFKKFTEQGDMDALFGTAIKEVRDLLKNDLPEDILMKWNSFKQQVQFVLIDMLQNFDGLRVIVHGDCWNNNFMFQNSIDSGNVPTKLAILDWQLAKLSSPIFDLSYFLFACISKDDIENLNEILGEYYESFSSYLRRLGSNPDALYTSDQFFDEWNKYSKFGILMAPAVMKICSTDKDEVPDIIETAEKGEDFSTAFSVEIKDKANLKNRMYPVVKYAVDNGLI